MGIYDSIRSAKVSRSGAYFKEGKYRVEIKSVKEVSSSQKPGKVFFVVETKCLSSTNPEIHVDQDYSQVIDLGNVMGMPNVKAFLAAASGVDPDTSDELLNDAIEKSWSELLERQIELPQICELVTSAQNPLEGLVLNLDCVNIKTKAGGDFTKYRWHPVVEA